MTKEKSPESSKKKFDLGGLFKGLFKGKKSQKTSAIEASQPEEASIDQPQKRRPATTKTISLTKEKRVFHSLATVGPDTGALHNIWHILMRRGYDVALLPLHTTRKGSFVKHSLNGTVPDDCECIILFEPDSIAQAESITNDMRKTYNLPIILITRRITDPNWNKEIVKGMEFSGKCMLNFSFNKLLSLFAHIASTQTPSEQNKTDKQETSIPEKPKPKAPEPSSTQEPLLVEVPPVESPPSEVLNKFIIEEASPEPSPIIEKKTDIIAENTMRPMPVLAPLADEPDLYYRIIGRELEGIDPQRILSRNEFETLLNTRFQEKWKITRIQDPDATPPVLIEVSKLTDEPATPTEQISMEAPNAKEIGREEISLENTPPVEFIVEAKTKETAGTKEQKQALVVEKEVPADLSEEIKNVRKWWQAGRVAKIYTEMEKLRRSIPDVQEMDKEYFYRNYIPLLEGSILFAKGRLDRTVKTTLQEVCLEDITRNGLQAPLRLLSMISACSSEKYKESFTQASEAMTTLLSKLIPEEDRKEEFEEAETKVNELLDQLDVLVNKTFTSEVISAGEIFSYFEDLHKITLDLHKQMQTIDDNMMLFGKLDRIIMRSQTRSDWAIGHEQDSGEGRERMKKFIHFLAEIRVGSHDFRQELDRLNQLKDKGIETVVVEMRNAPYEETPIGTPMERDDNEHLKDTSTNKLWRIDSHRDNYLLHLLSEDDPPQHAFATFEEESITYKWLGKYE